ncbi:MAG: OmpA family protein [Campylobacterota bacterium]|nr:OmpA family protein [Campylobacterota bacterium]
MKKLLLIPALMLSVSLMANDNKYEITPVIGYNFSEGNLGLDNSALYGAEFQYNALDTFLKPELSVLYSDIDIENSNLDADIYRVALNGVYEYEKMGIFTPLAKVGIGYETIDGTHNTPNSDGAFLDAGVGAKIALAKNIALKLEAVYMLKDGVKGSDNALATLAGLNFAFGAKAQKEPEATPEIVEIPTPDIESVLAPIAPIAPSTPIDGDDDYDGVFNSTDLCPTTPANQIVDANGCMLLVDLDINFRTNSYKVDAPSNTNLDNFAKFLELKPNYTAQITGHTDNRGDASYNKSLSKNRADAVKTLIVEKGVSADRIATDGMGEESPKATNSTKEGRAENRRIEASLIKN